MPQQVDVCPYCGGTFPHQGPTGCPPIKWPPDPQPEWRVTEWDGPSDFEFVYEVTHRSGRSIVVRRVPEGWHFVDLFGRFMPSTPEQETIKEVVKRYALEHQHFFPVIDSDPFPPLPPE